MSKPTNDRRRQNMRFRFAWIDAAMASRLKAGPKLVAVRLGLHRNDETLVCNPSVEALVRGTRLSERYVYDCLGELRDGKWIVWQENPGGVRHSNQYLLLPDNVPATLSPSSGLGGDEPCTGAQQTLSWGTVNPDLGRSEPCNGAQPNLNLNLNHKSEANIYGHPSSNGREEGNEGSEQVEGQEAADEEIAKASGPLSNAEIDARFDEFWKQCPRAVDNGKARKVYHRVVKSGDATPAELLHAMMIYAAAREGEDARYNKTPAKWLEHQCWKDDPEAIAPKSKMQRGFAAFGLAAALRAAATNGFAPFGAPSPPPDSKPPYSTPPLEYVWATRVKAALRVKMGDRAFEEVEQAGLSFDRIIGRNGDQIVYLTARGPIEEAIGGALLECWRAEVPTVTSVKVLTIGLDDRAAPRRAARG